MPDPTTSNRIMTSDPCDPPAETTSVRGVITGGSSGIGQSAAVLLAERFPGGPKQQAGAESRLLVHFRNNREGAEATVAAIRDRGVAAEAIAADLRDAGDRQRLVTSAWEFLEAPNTWINNAGADVLTGEFAHAGFEDKLRVLLETDLLGTISLSREVASRLLRHTTPQQPPSMTFIGWDQAPRGMEGDAGQMFGPVKAGVMAFANSLAQELAPRIRVNTVAPGWIKTAWGEEADGYWDRRAQSQALMNRWGTPADVARAIAFVSDPRNTFCSGQTIEVNGGWKRTFERDR